MAPIDAILNRVTMYRLTLYYLCALFAAGVLFSLFGVLSYAPLDLLCTAAVLIAVSLATNTLFARVFHAATSMESSYITALIIALIIPPVAPANFAGLLFLAFAGVWAMSAKYIVAFHKKHLFNPAAFAVAIGTLLFHQPATWWIGGNLWLLPFVLIGGLLLVRKIRRFDLVLSFAAAAALTLAAFSGADAGDAILQMLGHSPFFFLAFVMLTEPSTTPPTRAWRMLYGALVGFLFVPDVHVGSFYLTPELALLIGNVFSYAVSPKGRLLLTLKKIERPAAGVLDFIFSPNRHLCFEPGQYLEWTLAHASPDARGNRRYFTIASSPAEEHLRLGVRFYAQPSSFKRALEHMRIGDTIHAAHLAGGFTLPKDANKKLAFIAGGIGVTPFRSMVEDLLNRKEKRDIALFYANRTLDTIAYKELFDRAGRELGITTVYTVDDAHAGADLHPGPLTPELLAQEIPDYRERTFYLSGPPSMVDAFKETLRAMGVSRWRIKTDFFIGLA